MMTSFARRSGFIVLVLSIAVLSSCARTAESEETGDAAGNDSGSASEVRREKIDPAAVQATWQLESFEGEGQSEPTVANGDITLEFSDEGTIRGSSGCNNYRSTYRLTDDGSVVFGALATTRMACRPEIMEQETRYQRILENASRVRVEDDRLSVLDAEGNVALRFVWIDLTQQEEYPEEPEQGD